MVTYTVNHSKGRTSEQSFNSNKPLHTLLFGWSTFTYKSHWRRDLYLHFAEIRVKLTSGASVTMVL